MPLNFLPNSDTILRFMLTPACQSVLNKAKAVAVTPAGQAAASVLAFESYFTMARGYRDLFMMTAPLSGAAEILAGGLLATAVPLIRGFKVHQNSGSPVHDRRDRFLPFPPQPSLEVAQKFYILGESINFPVCGLACAISHIFFDSVPTDTVLMTGAALAAAVELMAFMARGGPWGLNGNYEPRFLCKSYLPS